VPVAALASASAQAVRISCAEGVPITLRRLEMSYAPGM
jgi:hypothetical protein